MPHTVTDILFPGRHHLLTCFQASYLLRATSDDAGLMDDRGAAIDAFGAAIHVAITSWDHGSTRRNPVPGHRREAIVERVAAETSLDLRAWPIPDVPPTARFHEYLLESIVAVGGPRLEPASCAVACSTPAVADLFRAAGFRILPVEAGAAGVERPWDVLERMVAARSIDAVADAMHPAAIEVWRRYGLLEGVLRAHADPLLTDEGNLTDTRDYATYAKAFDSGAPRKWAQLRGHVVPGRVVDMGCGAGSLLMEAAADPDLAESDLFGIEVTRSLHEECQHRRAAGAFANPNTFFFQRNIVADRLFDPASVDTSISTALTHELWSYIGEHALRAFVEHMFEQARPGGVWLNLDVCGPIGGDRPVWIQPRPGVTVQGLPTAEGTSVLTLDAGGAPVPRDLTGASPGDLEALLPRLSPLEGFVQFAHDWHGDAQWRLIPSDESGLPTPMVETTLRTAMEWLSKKDYPDNWLSEMHESFCFWDERDWRTVVEAAGFELAPGSGATTNPWLVEHRFASTATLHPAGEPGSVMAWPHTHVLLACRRPRAHVAAAPAPVP